MANKNIAFFIFLGIFFYFLNLFQISFLGALDFWPHWLNFSVLITIIICVFEESKKLLGLFAAFWAGLFLDIYSGSVFFGLFTIIFLLIAIFLKLILYRYVKLPPWQWLSKIQS